LLCDRLPPPHHALARRAPRIAHLSTVGCNQAKKRTAWDNSNSRSSRGGAQRTKLAHPSTAEDVVGPLPHQLTTSDIPPADPHTYPHTHTNTHTMRPSIRLRSVAALLVVLACALLTSTVNALSTTGNRLLVVLEQAEDSGKYSQLIGDLKGESVPAPPPRSPPLCPPASLLR